MERLIKQNKYIYIYICIYMYMYIYIQTYIYERRYMSCTVVDALKSKRRARGRRMELSPSLRHSAGGTVAGGSAVALASWAYQAVHSPAAACRELLSGVDTEAEDLIGGLATFRELQFLALGISVGLALGPLVDVIYLLRRQWRRLIAAEVQRSWEPARPRGLPLADAQRV